MHSAAVGLSVSLNEATDAYYPHRPDCYGCGLYFLDQYWIHRYDSVIAREAARYHVDPDLVWSIAYEETYFSPWKKGRNGEIGLMQVTPVVAREWAAENGAAPPCEQRTRWTRRRFS